MNDNNQIKKGNEINYVKLVGERTKNIPRNWFCRLFGYFPDCKHCDPDMEAQPLIHKNS